MPRSLCARAVGSPQASAFLGNAALLLLSSTRVSGDIPRNVNPHRAGLKSLGAGWAQGGHGLTLRAVCFLGEARN